MNIGLDNANPVVYECTKDRDIRPEDEDDDVTDKIDEREVFDLVRSINDPEHPLTLEELNVLEYRNIQQVWLANTTITDCSLEVETQDRDHQKNCIKERVLLRTQNKCFELMVSDDDNTVMIEFTPTIPHCSMATLIGLSIRVKLLRALPSRFKVDVKISPGTHATEDAVNKQLADKERVAAALENSHLLEVVNQCLDTKKKLR